MSWQPKRHERVIAVLPDGTEVPATYDVAAGGMTRHWVVLGRTDSGVTYDALVPAVKPVPVEEPKTFGACVKDRHGLKWVRVVGGGAAYWRSRLGAPADWSALLLRGPVTIVNADPWGES